MEVRDQIMQRLFLLAEQSGEKVSETRIEFITREVVDAKGDIVSALERLLRKSRRFPTVKEILAEAGTLQTDEDAGREVGERIWNAICRHGSQRFDLKSVLGEVGSRVVQMQGGWQSICDTATYDNASQLKAQWRELAEVLIRKARSGDLDALPKFDAIQGSKHDEALRIAGGGVIDIGRRK